MNTLGILMLVVIFGGMIFGVVVAVRMVRKVLSRFGDVIGL